MRLKKLNDQVMVITGATSGIGLVTARMASRYGTKLVLAARNEDALQELLTELAALGAQAIYVTADVGKEEDVRRIADNARQHFGGFDTWVNNAAVSIYGPLAQVTTADHHRLMDTNFWGTVYGSLIAVEHLRKRGGALINIGSALSERAIPLQGMYCASKHAVKGFTDSLRMELEKEKAPVSVTLIKPSAIDTPYTEHAKNYLPVAPKNPPPVYAPELVAEAILHCAEHPTRDLTVGAGGKGVAVSGAYAPRLTDKFMEWAMFNAQQSSKPAGTPDQHSLYEPKLETALKERGEYEGHVSESSLYTKAAMHPKTAMMLLLGATLALLAFRRPNTT